MLDAMMAPYAAGLDMATNPQKYDPETAQEQNPLATQMASATLAVGGTRELIDSTAQALMDGLQSDILDALL